jgi:hypothetical protein
VAVGLVVVEPSVALAGALVSTTDVIADDGGEAAGAEVEGLLVGALTARVIVAGAVVDLDDEVALTTLGGLPDEGFRRDRLALPLGLELLLLLSSTNPTSTCKFRNAAT